jgi:hypothetical protein
MADDQEPNRHVVDPTKLPADYPTHLHSPEFWAALGRTVATFGFLEQMLGKAILSFTATRHYEDDEIEAAFDEWLPTLKRALSDPLGGLIESYGKAVRANKEATIENLDELIAHLREASAMRNALCHGSWGPPDDKGRSVPFFVDRKDRVFGSAVDVAFLQQVQQHAAELACAVVNTVTHMGWQFPGSSGPGNPILQTQSACAPKEERI